MDLQARLRSLPFAWRAFDRAPRPAVPSPPAEPLLGHVRSMREAPLRFLLEASRHGDVVRLVLPRMDAYLVTSPDDVKRILQDNHRNYTKQTRGYQVLRLGLGEGLLTSEGSFWLRQRRIAQPAFHKERLRAFAAIMARNAEDLGERWAQLARAGATVDVSEEAMAVTLRIVVETLFGADAEGREADVKRAMDTLIPAFRRRITRLVDVPLEWPLPEHRRLRAALGTLDAEVNALVRRRRASGGGGDLLGLLMQAEDEETGARMTDAQLRDEVMTMFLAGHETTANLLAWTFYLLSLHPCVARDLEAEVTAALGGRTPGWDDVPKLPFTRSVLQEALRLYPPAWAMTRHVVDADVLGGVRIPAGAVVFVSPWVTHRSPRLWDNPEGFDPERFTPTKSAGRHPFAFFPFSGGPRVCIGNAFALLEAQIVLATLVQRARADLVPGHPVEPEPAVTLRPRHGVRMTLRPAAG